MTRARLILTIAFVSTTTAARSSHAAEGQRPVRVAPSEELDRTIDGTLELFAALSLGRGLRFNNPYRLATVLGSDAASLSLTASYIDASAAAVYGSADGLRHGAQFHVGGAIEGVRQPFLSVSYLLAGRPDDAWMLYARVGPSVLLGPDPNVGGELGASASWFVSQGLGLTSELVGNLYYGAATLDRQASIVPIVSLQLGVIADVELLP
jgi:hypothetical protein